MMSYRRNYFFWTAILVIATLVVMGYKAATADSETTYNWNQNDCDYAAVSVANGEMTQQEYSNMGCD